MNIVHEMKLWRLGIGIYLWPEYQRIDLWPIYLQTIHELFANRELFAEHCIMLCISVCSQGALQCTGGSRWNSLFPSLQHLHSTLYTLNCTLYTVHCTLYNTYTLHWKLYTKYNIHFTLCTLHKVQNTLYTLHPGTLYTLHQLHQSVSPKLSKPDIVTALGRSHLSKQ